MLEYIGISSLLCQSVSNLCFAHRTHGRLIGQPAYRVSRKPLIDLYTGYVIILFCLRQIECLITSYCKHRVHCLNLSGREQQIYIWKSNCGLSKIDEQNANDWIAIDFCVWGLGRGGTFFVLGFRVMVFLRWHFVLRSRVTSIGLVPGPPPGLPWQWRGKEVNLLLRIDLLGDGLVLMTLLLICA